MGACILNDGTLPSSSGCTAGGLGRLFSQPQERPTQLHAEQQGTHPWPRQPSLRLTSLCSKPSSRERSSGEKESGSSTALREEWDTGRGRGRASGPITALGRGSGPQ